MAKKQQITLEEMKEYGDFFKFMRESIGLKTDEMAKEIGVFRTTYVKWEKASIIPQQDIFEIEQKVREVVKNTIKKQRSNAYAI